MKKIITLLSLVSALAVSAADCLNFDTSKTGRDCLAKFKQSNYFGKIDTVLTVEHATAHNNKVEVRFVAWSAGGALTTLDTKLFYGSGIGQTVSSHYNLNACGSAQLPWQWEIVNYWSLAAIVEVFEPAQYQNGVVIRWNSIGKARVDGTRDH